MEKCVVQLKLGGSAGAVVVATATDTVADAAGNTANATASFAVGGWNGANGYGPNSRVQTRNIATPC